MWFLVGFIFGAIFMFLLVGVHIIWRDDRDIKRKKVRRGRNTDKSG